VETNYVYRIWSKEGKGAGTKRGRPDERGELRVTRTEKGSSTKDERSNDGRRRTRGRSWGGGLRERSAAEKAGGSGGNNVRQADKGPSCTRGVAAVAE
jgi:hypothetical protein